MAKIHKIVDEGFHDSTTNQLVTYFGDTGKKPFIFDQQNVLRSCLYRPNLLQTKLICNGKQRRKKNYGDYKTKWTSKMLQLKCTWCDYTWIQMVNESQMQVRCPRCEQFVYVLNDSKREDNVRKALGVEKKYTVCINIPVVGLVTMKEIIVTALDEKAAKNKAVEIVENGEEDANGDTAEIADFDYDYAPKDEWDVKANA